MAKVSRRIADAPQHHRAVPPETAFTLSLLLFKTSRTSYTNNAMCHLFCFDEKFFLCSIHIFFFLLYFHVNIHTDESLHVLVHSPPEGSPLHSPATFPFRTTVCLPFLPLCHSTGKNDSTVLQS